MAKKLWGRISGTATRVVGYPVAIYAAAYATLIQKGVEQIKKISTEKKDENQNGLISAEGPALEDKSKEVSFGEKFIENAKVATNITENAAKAAEEWGDRNNENIANVVTNAASAGAKILVNSI